MTTQFSAAFLLLILFVHQLDAFQDHQKKEISSKDLIEQLNSEKYSERIAASRILKSQGAKAIPVLFDGLMDNQSHKHVHVTCFRLLTSLAENDFIDSEEVLRNELKKYPIDSHPVQKRQLAKLRMLVLGELGFDEIEARKRLISAGAKIEKSNDRLKVDLADWKGSHQTLLGLHCLQSPIELNFPYALGPQALAKIATCDIRSLSFNERLTGKFQINDSSRKMSRLFCLQILKLKRLERLYFSSAIEEGAMDGIDRLENLQILNMPIGFSRKTIVALGKLPKLESLRFSLGKHGPRGDVYAPLASIKSLRSIWFGDCQFDPVNFKYLSRIPLMSLSCPRHSTNDETIKEIAKIKTLENLVLEGSMVTDVGLNELHSLRKLRSIRIGWSSITDQSVKTLNRLELEKVWLHSTMVTKSGFDEIKCGDKTTLGKHILIGSEQLEVIHHLTKQGFVIKKYNHLKSLVVAIPHFGLREQRPDMSELSKLEVEYIDIWNAMDGKLLGHLFQLKPGTPVRIFHSETTDKTMSKLREHFEQVRDFRTR